MLDMGLRIKTMSGISSVASSWLNALTTSGNWLQSATSSTASADWIDSVSSSNSLDSMSADANAFATAEQNLTSSLNSNTVNNAVTALQSQASGQTAAQSQTSGQSVNILA